MDNKMQYKILLESASGNRMIDWGNEPDWQEKHAEQLESATRLMAVPRDDSDLPIVSVSLDNSKRWILFSRVIGQVTSGKEIRLYAIGWQSTVGGKNVKNIIWVYPNGMVENADQPSFWRHFL